MNRRHFVGALGAGLGFVFVPRLPRWRADGVFVERWSWAMGQPVPLMVLAGSEQEGLAACRAAVAELRRVEGRLTLLDTASALGEVNRRAGLKGMRVDRDLRAVLAQAAAFKRATGGAFNVAVEPLMRVWGFHRHRASAPTAAELAEAREAVLAAVVELDGDVARLPSAHTQLDFGAIGVGYGIDRALELLRARGLRRAFIDVSGDMAAIGAPPGEPGWRVGIADPDQPGAGDRKSTRLNSSHDQISYAVFCLKKKKKKKRSRSTPEKIQNLRTTEKTKRTENRRDAGRPYDTKLLLHAGSTWSKRNRPMSIRPS